MLTQNHLLNKENQYFLPTCETMWFKDRNWFRRAIFFKKQIIAVGKSILSSNMIKTQSRGMAVEFEIV